MKKLFCYLSAFVCLIASSMASAKTKDQLQFESLLRSPGRIVTLYDDEAFILELGKDSYQAVFITIEDARKQRICSYGVDFLNDVSIESGTYRLKTDYHCQKQDQFQPYGGTFKIGISRKCDEFCPIGGAGVGNLKVGSGNSLNPASLPNSINTIFTTLRVR